MCPGWSESSSVGGGWRDGTSHAPLRPPLPPGPLVSGCREGVVGGCGENGVMPAPAPTFEVENFEGLESRPTVLGAPGNRCVRAWLTSNWQIASVPAEPSQNAQHQDVAQQLSHKAGPNSKGPRRVRVQSRSGTDNLAG